MKKVLLFCVAVAVTAVCLAGACLLAARDMTEFVLRAGTVDSPMAFRDEYPLLYLLSPLIGVDVFNTVKLLGGEAQPFCLSVTSRLLSWGSLFLVVLSGMKR